jgi:hypothetical protein
LTIGQTDALEHRKSHHVTRRDYAGILSCFVIWHWRADYWLLTDSKQGIALVTNKYWGGHGVYEYEYEVNQHKYAGRSRRNFKEEKYRNVGPGGHFNCVLF